jgi:hypothetical protein
MNCAMWHAKKMWLQSSTSPQREQQPFDSPCRLATCSLQGSLPRMSCQRKTLILGGTLVFQTSLKWVTARPPARLWYMELVEYWPDASSLHPTKSSSKEVGRSCISLHKFSHWTASARPNCLQKWSCQAPGFPSKIRAPWAVMKGWSQQLNNRANLKWRGPDPNHQSCQQKVCFPLRTWCLAPSLKSHLIF